MIIFCGTNEYIIGPGVTFAGGGGEANDGANLGTGFEVYANKTGVTLNFRTISPEASNFDTTQTATEIEFDLTDTGVTPGTYTNATVTVDAKGRVTNIVAGTPLEVYRYLQAECLAQVSNTIGWFSRATASGSNPGGYAVTQSTNVYQNSQLTPWLLQGTWRVIDIKVLVSAAAVSTATVGATPTLRLDFYQVNTASRTAITNGVQRLPVIAGAGDINANNSLANAPSFIYFAKSDFSGLFIEPANSTLFGFEFVNESGSEDTINAMFNATAHITLQKI
jgi:hypothetical protein